ncbi:CRISPR-associated protein Cas5 [Pseudothermotoga thermarum]|uniref:CRISPR-associated protein Cas5 n=1 Tax=Pseudothermotoga thermarum DSM 5069 TaxID=688269 RepID=F7YTL0_9THEM|nr:CRISPR-associated protein Cas5 [Pseudothermotoga thermarum]AEH51232.1 CRISPR-associated protein Cas5 [Pseudothermotoga thermarum DSM 5069]
MKALWVKVIAQACSFRPPLDHVYQRTLPLPPPTTILGFAGAALGLEDKAIWSQESPLLNVKVSALLLNKPGFAKDMWKILKIDNYKISERSPYFREMLFNARYMLVYGSADEDFLKRLKEAILDPVYALSLGREDELVLVEECDIAELQVGGTTFYGTALAGDISKMKFHWIPKGGVKFEPPICENMPVAFEVDKDGRRYPRSKQLLTFLPYDLHVVLNEPVNSYTLEILKGRNFTWMS